jgi:hypothetical protein
MSRTSVAISLLNFNLCLSNDRESAHNSSEKYKCWPATFQKRSVEIREMFRPMERGGVRSQSSKAFGKFKGF